MDAARSLIIYYQECEVFRILLTITLFNNQLSPSTTTTPYLLPFLSPPRRTTTPTLQIYKTRKPQPQKSHRILSPVS